MRLVLRQGGVVVLGAVGLGLVVAGALLLIALAVLAMWLPTSRATRVEPVKAPRSE